MSIRPILLTITLVLCWSALSCSPSPLFYVDPPYLPHHHPCFMSIRPILLTITLVLCRSALSCSPSPLFYVDPPYLAHHHPCFMSIRPILLTITLVLCRSALSCSPSPLFSPVSLSGVFSQVPIFFCISSMVSAIKVISSAYILLAMCPLLSRS